MWTTLAGAALVGAVIACSAQAATLTGGVTEGRRDTVIGTTHLGSDASPRPNGASLGRDLVAGDLFGIYGRIVGSQDVFELNFSSAASFIVLFDFDGYGTANTSNDGVGAVTRTGAQSGLMSVFGGRNNNFSPVPANPNNAPDGGKQVRISLIDLDTNSVADFGDYFTNINSATGDDALIFSAAAGNYSLKIDGRFRPTKNASAFYDLKIHVVPLPASVFLLLAGLGGLGLMGCFAPQCRFIT